MRRWAAVLAACAACAACGGADTSVATTAAATSPADTGSGHGLVFSISVHLTGAQPLSATLSDRSVTSVDSCAAWAQSGVAGIMAVPGSGLPSAPVSYGALIQGYHGPADYTDLGNLLALIVNRGHASFDAVQGTSSLRITIAADGSGVMAVTAFQDLADSSKRESGTISWRCAPAP